MTIVKVAQGKYINVDRMTFVEPKRGGQLLVHFAAGGGDLGGPFCQTKLDQGEAEQFVQWLDGYVQST